MSFPDGTEIEAHTGYGTEEGLETEYIVSETLLKKEPLAGPDVEEDDLMSFVPHLIRPYNADGENRDVSLRVDPTSVKVHYVVSVKVNTTRRAVPRHRSEKRDAKF